MSYYRVFFIPEAYSGVQTHLMNTHESCCFSEVGRSIIIGKQYFKLINLFTTEKTGDIQFLLVLSYQYTVLVESSRSPP